MEQKRSIFAGFAITLLSLILLFGWTSVAFADDYQTTEGSSDVFQTTMSPWMLSAYATDGSLADYDAAYRRTYRPDAIHQSNGTYHQNVIANIAADDDKFWEGSSGGQCTVDFTFDAPIDFTHIVYGSRLDASLKGFATEFNVYTSQTTDGADWRKIAHGTGEAMSSLCAFDVCPDGQSVTARRVRFEFVHSSQEYPSIRAMRFYRDDPHERTLDQIWGDFAKTKFADGFDSAKVKATLEHLKSVPGYDVVYAPYVQRAWDVADGKIVYDQSLERSNQANRAASERTSDAIGRWGDVAGYARSTLKYPNNTTNRQPTGIWYPANETIHIWVYRQNPDDPLPKIHWAQPYGYWASWRGGVTQLAEGENVLTVPNFKTVDYKTYDIVAGNVAYLENPYTEDEQTGEVKVYFEGGRSYPVYRLGDDIDAYMKELRLHADRIRADRTSDMDCTELVSDHAIMTVRATQADYLYGSRGHDAKQSLEVWQDTLHRVYQFDGIEFEPGKPGYDPRNAHLNENYRVSQVWDLGWMFTAGEHIGVYTGDEAENVLIDALDENGVSRIPGNWGLIHEFGHSIDIPDRTIQETTNNMAANYVATRDAGFIRNQKDIDRANAMADPDYVSGTKFSENRFNFMPFFLVESYWPGWWGKVERLYRDPKVYTEAVAGLPKTERFVYLASLAAGYDLGYWYEKWGLNIDAAKEAPFTVDAASEEYRRLMETARFNRKINDPTKIEGVDGALPLWYLDAAEFNYITDHGLDAAVLYDETAKPAIKRVNETATGHSVTITPPEDERHLLFEVYGRASADDEWRFLGITYGGTYADDDDWGDADPEYRVRAIDRALHHSQYSDPCTITRETEIARVGTMTYDSLSAAIDAALAAPNPIVTVLKDCVAPSVELTQPLTLRAETAVDIACAGTTPMFALSSGAQLNIEGSADAPITFDGEYAKTDGPAIKVTGGATLTVHNARFTAWESTGQGSALGIEGGTVSLADVAFDGNHASDGGAIANRGDLTLERCVLSGNGADDEGGALRNHSGGVVRVIACTLTNNSAVHGGAISVDGFTSIRGGEISGNAATYGGGIEQAVNANQASRVLAIDDDGGVAARIHDNAGVRGDGLYARGNGYVFIGDAEIEGSGDGSALYLANGTAVLNADGDRVARTSRTLATGLLKTFGAEGSTVIDGEIHNVGGAIETVNRWPEGAPTYGIEDWGRVGVVVTCDGFDGSSEWEQRVVTAGDAKPALIYEANDAGDGGSVRVALGGKVTLHANGGEIKSGMIEGYVAGAVTYLPTQVTKTGCSFVGWFDNEACEGASVRSIGDDQEGDKDFWAKWSDGIYWINYRPNGGKLPAEPVLKTHRSLEETVALEIPTRDGFTFLGWYENSEFKGEPIARIEGNSREGDITLYARWTHGRDKGTVVETEPATCTAPGYTITVYKCVDCKEEMAVERAETPALGHDFGEWTAVDTSGACGMSGYKKRTCKTCGFVETDGVSGAHEWGAWTPVVAGEEACDVDRAEQRLCQRCGALESRVTKGGHLFSTPVMDEETVVAPTCDLPGHHELVATCERCGESHIVEHVETPALGHDFGALETVTEGDCAQGVGECTERTCERCGYVEQTTKPVEHHWESERTNDRSATCTEPGLTSIHCEDCGATTDSRETPALGHDFSDPTSAHCLRCDEPNPTYAPQDDVVDAEERIERSVGDGGEDESESNPNESDGLVESNGASRVGEPGAGDAGSRLEPVGAHELSCVPELATQPTGAQFANEGLMLAQTGDGRFELIVGLAICALIAAGAAAAALVGMRRAARPRGSHQRR